MIIHHLFPAFLGEFIDDFDSERILFFFSFYILITSSIEG